MKAARFLLLFTLISAVVSSASGQSISGQSPVVRDHKVFWPLAFQFDGSGPTVDVGDSPRLNTSTFTISAFVKFNALSHPPGSNGYRPAGDMSIVDKISNTEVDNADGWRLLKQNDGFFWFCFGGGMVNGCTGEAATSGGAGRIARNHGYQQVAFGEVSGIVVGQVTAARSPRNRAAAGI